MPLDTRPTPAESQRRQIRLAAARAAIQDLTMADRLALALELPHGALLDALAAHHAAGYHNRTGALLRHAADTLRLDHEEHVAELAKRGVELAPDEAPLIDTRAKTPARPPSPLRRFLASVAVAFGVGAS